MIQNRLTDLEARLEIKKLLGPMEIAHVKSLLKGKVKGIEGLSLCQAGRIFLVSLSLVFKA